MIEAYPLYWPEGRPRTTYRESARFETSFARARDNVLREVELLCGRYEKADVIISTNLPLRRDGLPLASARAPENPGVAVYFTYKKRQQCFACDRWNKIEDNMQAICKTIEALRGIARWGTGDMMAAAFKGFEAPSTTKPWHEVFGCTVHQDTETVRANYRRAAAANHPDRGGSHDQMALINRAWAEFCKERGLT